MELNEVAKQLVDRYVKGSRMGTLRVYKLVGADLTVALPLVKLLGEHRLEVLLGVSSEENPQFSKDELLKATSSLMKTAAENRAAELLQKLQGNES